MQLSEFRLKQWEHRHGAYSFFSFLGLTVKVFSYGAPYVIFSLASSEEEMPIFYLDRQGLAETAIVFGHCDLKISEVPDIEDLLDNIDSGAYDKILNYFEWTVDELTRFQNTKNKIQVRT
jgi:hypothetical protein